MSIATDNLRVVVLEHGKGLITPVSLEALKCNYVMCARLCHPYTKRVTRVITQWKIIMSTVILRFWQTMVAS